MAPGQHLALLSAQIVPNISSNSMLQYHVPVIIYTQIFLMKGAMQPYFPMPSYISPAALQAGLIIY